MSDLKIYYKSYVHFFFAKGFIFSDVVSLTVLKLLQTFFLTLNIN